jgi:hypothetical protein
MRTGPARVRMNRTDVTPIIEARSDTEPAESHIETVQAGREHRPGDGKKS